MFSSQPYTFDRVVRIIINLAVFVAVIFLIYYLRSVLLPFGVACLVAYLLEPFVQFNRKLLRLKGRIVAVFITLFEAIFFVSLLIYLLTPSIVAEAHKMSQLLEQYAGSKSSIPFLPDTIQDFIRTHVDFKQISSLLTREEWTSLIEKSVTASWSVITGSIELLVGLFGWCIVLLYLIFIMLDYDNLSRSFSHLVPPRHRKIASRIGNDIKSSMNHYFRGQTLVAASVGVLFAIGFSIIGLPMAVVMGFFIFILTLVPYLQLLSIPFVAILCLVCSVGEGVSFWTIFGESIAIYCIVQVINDVFLTPKIMGKAMGLNPAIILLSLSVWGALMGLLGLIIALPMTTLLIAYYDEFVIGNRDESNRQRQDDAEAIERATNDLD
ncbi:MAG: AI-2E family transporter [Muribaculaceae bacterium]|nr:AI-2E family transporter [Muribaculaceae bacterium]